MTSPIIKPASKGESQLANKWVFQVDTSGDPLTPAWLTVFGVSAFTPSIDYTSQDNSDFDSDGWASSKQTQRSWSVTGTTQSKTYAKAEDPGQKFLRLAAFNSRDVRTRWFDRYFGEEAQEGSASVKWMPQGGGVTDLQTANFELAGQGKPKLIVNPLYAAPTITAALPGSATVGQSVVIDGGGFAQLSGATAVKFGAVNATSYYINDASQLVAVMPAGTAGAANIVVTNPWGASTAFTYTRGA